MFPFARVELVVVDLGEPSAAETEVLRREFCGRCLFHDGLPWLKGRRNRDGGSIVPAAEIRATKKAGAKNAPTFLIIALFTRASTSVVKGIGRCGHCERQKRSSAHQQCR